MFMMKRILPLMMISFSFSQELSQLSFIETNGFVLSIYGTENYAFFSENGDSYSIFKSVDISDPRTPIVIDSLITTGFITDFDINGNYAYLAMADAEFGLRILNISDPSEISEVIFIDGTEANGIFYNNNFLYVADGGGLKVYDVSTPDTLNFSWLYHTPNTDGIRAFLVNDFVYLTVLNTGMYIINNNSHELEGTVSSPNVMLGLYANGNNAFISDNNFGFVSIDINDSQNPFVIDTLSGTGGPTISGDIAVSGNYAYFADGASGLKVIDISDPSLLELKNVFSPINIFSYGVASYDTLVYLGCENGLYILTMEFLSAIEDNSIYSPKDFSLSQNYPNPFNAITTIDFLINTRGLINLSVYDATGRKVETLINKKMNVGTYSVVWDASNLSSGIYFVTMTSNAFIQTQKTLLLK